MDLPDKNCITQPDGSCVGGRLVGKESCMHDAPLDGCPQPGSGGVHSRAYLEGDGICQWCAAEPPTEATPSQSAERSAEFERWFLENYPPDTVLTNPAWHASKIYRRASEALQGRKLPVLHAAAQCACDDFPDFPCPKHGMRGPQS